ncbi:MAG: histidine phosphatase family protein [Ideonella sp.]
MHRSTRVLAIRHGETAWNVETRIQGQLDIGLNDIGRWQAQRLAAVLGREELSAVYSSDLSRAFDTATIAAEQLGLPVEIDEGLRERHFGSFQGLTFKEIEVRWPEQSERWRKRDPAFAPPGGESLMDFYERCVGAAQRIAAARPSQAIALVAHGGVLDCLYRAATRQTLQAPRTWMVTNAGINRLLHSEQGFSLVGWADSSHLDSAELALDEASDGVVALDRLGPAA